MSFTEIKERFNPDAKFKHSQFIDYANLLADKINKNQNVDSKLEMNEAMIQFIERQTEKQNTAKKEVQEKLILNFFPGTSKSEYEDLEPNELMRLNEMIVEAKPWIEGFLNLRLLRERNLDWENTLGGSASKTSVLVSQVH
jgi:hypothetical protein